MRITTTMFAVACTMIVAQESWGAEWEVTLTSETWTRGVTGSWDVSYGGNYIAATSGKIVHRIKNNTTGAWIMSQESTITAAQNQLYAVTFAGLPGGTTFTFQTIVYKQTSAGPPPQYQQMVDVFGAGPDT